MPSYAVASLQTSLSGSPDPSPSAGEKPTAKAPPKVKSDAVCMDWTPSPTHLLSLAQSSHLGLLSLALFLGSPLTSTWNLLPCAS